MNTNKNENLSEKDQLYWEKIADKLHNELILLRSEQSEKQRELEKAISILNPKGVTQ